MTDIFENNKKEDTTSHASICCTIRRRRTLILPKFFCNLLEIKEGDVLLVQLEATQLIITPVKDTENLIHNTSGRPLNQKKLQRLLAIRATKRLTQSF